MKTQDEIIQKKREELERIIAECIKRGENYCENEEVIAINKEITWFLSRDEQ